MHLFQKTLIFLALVIPLLTACGSDGTDVTSPAPPAEATFDNATFDKSTWK